MRQDGRPGAILSARRLGLSAPALAAPACQVVQPISPRTVTAGSTTLGLDHLRGDLVAVSVRGAPVR